MSKVLAVVTIELPSGQFTLLAWYSVGSMGRPLTRSHTGNQDGFVQTFNQGDTVEGMEWEIRNLLAQGWKRVV